MDTSPAPQAEKSLSARYESVGLDVYHSSEKNTREIHARSWQLLGLRSPGRPESPLLARIYWNRNSPASTCGWTMWRRRPSDSPAAMLVALTGAGCRSPLGALSDCRVSRRPISRVDHRAKKPRSPAAEPLSSRYRSRDRNVRAGHAHSNNCHQ